MEQLGTNEVIFQHLINLPRCECVFVSTILRETGRKRLFLISNDREHIYRRNPSKETWEELIEEGEVETVRNGFHTALSERRLPCYQADDLDVF